MASNRAPGRSATSREARRVIDRGSVGLEATMAIFILMNVLLLGVNIARVTYVTIAGRYALQKTARWAILGESLERDLGAGVVTLDRVASIKLKLLEYGSPLGLDVLDAQVAVCPTANANCTTDDAGTENEMILIRWNYAESLLVWPIDYNFTFETFARNENFA